MNRVMRLWMQIAPIFEGSELVVERRSFAEAYEKKEKKKKILLTSKCNVNRESFAFYDLNYQINIKGKIDYKIFYTDITPSQRSHQLIVAASFYL